MSKLLSRLSGLFSSRTLVGVDKAGNRYFTRKDGIDGIAKEKRWVIFKSEEDPTSIPVEWICWLNGQRKQAPTPEEIKEFEARRELVKQNIALLKKKEEEERKAGVRRSKPIDKGATPDLGSFKKQFPEASLRDRKEPEEEAKSGADNKQESSEPTGSGHTYKPGTWQPPS